MARFSSRAIGALGAGATELSGHTASRDADDKSVIGAEIRGKALSAQRQWCLEWEKTKPITGFYFADFGLNAGKAICEHKWRQSR